MEKSQISSDLIRGHIDTIILYSLIDGDKFAQQIADHVKQKSDEKYEINQATLYSSLKRLENLKFVKAYWNDSDGGRRRFFSLTELGKKTVNDNLSNWSFSRAIIDKLMDVPQENIVKTVEVEKIVKVPEIVEVPVYIEKKIETTNDTANETKNNAELSIEKKGILAETVKTQNFEKDANITSIAEEQQEINFRNILSGLIKATAKQPKKVVNLKDETNVVENDEQHNNVLKFNETISNTSVSEVAPHAVGKIDFSDLQQKAVKEGYKLRISTKDARVVEGSVYINKVNLFASLSIFILVLLEVLLFSIICKGKISVALLIVSPIIAAILPCFCGYIFIKHPLKTSAPIKADTILTALIVFFNLLLITFALNLLFAVDFNESFGLISFFIYPVFIYLDIFLYFVIKYTFGKIKFFLAKKTK